MKLYALSRPLQRGRTNIALIADGNSGFFKFDTYAHTGHPGISPTGYKADTVTVEVDADIVGTPTPADAKSLFRRKQSSAVSMVNATAISFSQDGDTNEIIVQPVDRASNDFILFVDAAGR